MTFGAPRLEGASLTIFALRSGVDGTAKLVVADTARSKVRNANGGIVNR